MRSLPKYLLLALTVLLAASCNKKFETSIALAVDNEELRLSSADAGYFYLHVTSNRSWTISIEADSDWLHPEVTSGEGIQYPKINYDAYVGGVDREATLVVSCDVKTCRIRVIQPNSEQ